MGRFARIRVKLLDVGPKGVIVVHDNVIVPCVCRFQYYGETIAANIIFVIAATASERVGSALPEETIAFVIAPDVVRATVAEPFKSGSRQDKIFDVGLECVRNRGLDGVVATVDCLYHPVATSDSYKGRCRRARSGRWLRHCP